MDVYDVAYIGGSALIAAAEFHAIATGDANATLTRRLKKRKATHLGFFLFLVWSVLHFAPWPMPPPFQHAVFPAP